MVPIQSTRTPARIRDRSIGKPEGPCLKSASASSNHKSEDWSANLKLPYNSKHAVHSQDLKVASFCFVMAS